MSDDDFVALVSRFGGFTHGHICNARTGGIAVVATKSLPLTALLLSSTLSIGPIEGAEVLTSSVGGMQ